MSPTIEQVGKVTPLLLGPPRQEACIAEMPV